MKFFTVFLVVSLLLLNCFAADPKNENDKNLLKEKEVKNEGTLSEKGVINESTENTKGTENIKKTEGSDDTINPNESKTNKDTIEVPIWIKGFLEGIFFIIGILVAYRCFKSNEGHVTEEEWREMNKEPDGYRTIENTGSDVKIENFTIEGKIEKTNIDGEVNFNNYNYDSKK